ncbi:UNVERIFIED_CONTAM: hypothetical protein FKN15_001904 [Acipenser sinensis]
MSQARPSLLYLSGSALFLQHLQMSSRAFTVPASQCNRAEAAHEPVTPRFHKRASQPQCKRDGLFWNRGFRAFNLTSSHRQGNRIRKGRASHNTARYTSTNSLDKRDGRASHNTARYTSTNSLDKRDGRASHNTARYTSTNSLDKRDGRASHNTARYTSTNSLDKLDGRASHNTARYTSTNS